MSGGMIADVWQGRLSDGTEVVVKSTDYDAQLEAEGLEALGDAGAPVPSVVAVDTDVLVLELVRGEPDWETLGARVATVHRHRGDHFGWHRDNVIGPLPQDNGESDDWGEFYATRRVFAWSDADALPDEVRRRLHRACDGPLQALVDHDAPPSLVHGDLWSGNVVDGAYLIDPAVHHADREFELAFAALFGGIPRAFWNGYEAAWPLDDGWQDRRPALQLYHLLVHVELFGAGYVGQVGRRLDELGW